jgi:hypothetical protein
MSQDDKVRGPRDRLIIAATVSGQTQEQTARDVGCSVSTVSRARSRHADQIDQERSSLAEQQANRLLAGVGGASDRMIALVQSDSETVALSASKYLLDSALRWRESVSMEQRLSRLESQI